MNRDEFCQKIKKEFPAISARADKQYTRQWGDFKDTEYYSYSWFEALANALNEEMRKESAPEQFSELLKIISTAYETSEVEVRQAIDVAFVENLFWQVPEIKCKSYWEELPKNLKELYEGYHHRTPL
jgi:translation initiation factor 2 alpha subunit (eIF-2alpha)